jgi:hypothetical protein
MTALEARYDDESFDIVRLMSEARDPDTGLLRDLRIDDRDLKEASSFYDFAFTTIGKDAHPPWIVQGWTGLLLFGEVCTHCSDPRWLNLEWFVDHVPKDKPFADIKEGLTILKHGVCPTCGRHKHELIKDHGLHNYAELVNVLGQRSGKSASAAYMACYHTHRFLKFPRLADHTNAMQKSTELTSTFVSLTYAKAIGLLWTPYFNMISESSWYSAFHKMLDFYGNRYGVELYRKRDEYLKYFHKNLRCYPTNPKSQTLRGDTRKLAVIDELGLFPLPSGNDEEDEKSDRANADEAHKSLTNSLVTVQAIQRKLLAKGMNCPPALMLGVSSPISMRDKVMRRLQDAKTVEGEKYILGVNLATWNVNPSIDRDTPMIALAYASNPEKAERDFGANPPRVSQTFIKPQQVPLTLFSGKNTHHARYQYDIPEFIYGKLDRFYSPRWPSVLTIDAGYSNNSFALTGGHFDFDTQKTVISTVVEVMTQEGRKIDFNAIYLNMILPLIKDLNAVLLVADQWQSLDILSRAKADSGLEPLNKKAMPRCMTTQFSPKRKDFDFFLSMLENGNLVLPHLSNADYTTVCSEFIDYRTLAGQPVKHWLLQALTVQDQGVGKAPGKGQGFTDDLFRASVLLTKIHHPKVMERLKLACTWPSVGGAAKSSMPKPVYVSRSF